MNRFAVGSHVEIAFPCGTEKDQRHCNEACNIHIAPLELGLII
jgi:hypothetical protein